MSKDTYTGLYSDEAYEALTLTSALENFALRTANTDGRDHKSIHSSIKTPISMFTYYYHPNWVDNAWDHTAAITRDATNGEIVIKDYYTETMYHKSKTVFSSDDINWARDISFTNRNKMRLLSKGIHSTFTFLNEAFNSQENIHIEVSGPCWLEPENYHGIWSFIPSMMHKYPDRVRVFDVKLSTFALLTDYFEKQLCDADTIGPLIGEAWDPFKAYAVAEIRRRQYDLIKEARVRIFELTTKHDMTGNKTCRIADLWEMFRELEAQQKQIEIGLQK